MALFQEPLARGEDLMAVECSAEQLQKEKAIVLEFRREVARIPFVEWLSILVFWGLGELALNVAFESFANWVHYASLFLMIVLVIGCKRGAVKKLGEFPLYKMAVDKVLTGNVSRMGFMMRSFAKVVTFMTFGRLHTDEMMMPNLLMLTSVMGYAETAQTAFVLPSLLEAARQESDFYNIGAYLSFVVFGWNVLIHTLLFGLSLFESRRVAEQLPRFGSHHQSRSFQYSRQQFPKDAPDGTSSVVVTQNALRLMLWTMLQTAMWQGNLVLIAGVCAEILKQCSLLLPFSQLRPDEGGLNGWEEIRKIQDDDYEISDLCRAFSQSWKGLLLFGSGNVGTRTTNFSVTRFIFRILASSCAKAFLKLKALEETWCFLDPTERVSLTLSILIALFMVGLSLPDAFSETWVKTQSVLKTHAPCLFKFLSIYDPSIIALVWGVSIECVLMYKLYAIFSYNDVSVFSAMALNLTSSNCSAAPAN